MLKQEKVSLNKHTTTNSKNSNKNQIIQINIKQDFTNCPYCKKGELVTIMTFDNRGPPKILIGIDHKLLIDLKK